MNGISGEVPTMGTDMEPEGEGGPMSTPGPGSGLRVPKVSGDQQGDRRVAGWVKTREPCHSVDIVKNACVFPLLKCRQLKHLLNPSADA